jgi:ferritin-like metal-binding protein YciE
MGRASSGRVAKPKALSSNFSTAKKKKLKSKFSNHFCNPVGQTKRLALVLLQEGSARNWEGTRAFGKKVY